MGLRPVPAVLLLAAVPLLLGWFHVLSEETFFAVNPHVDYADIRSDPEQFRGTVVLLAGQIVKVAAGDEGTQMEVLCFTRDEADRPETPDPACGRFLITSPSILDVRHLGPGRLVTAAAAVTGEADGAAPVFSLVEMHVWPDPEQERELRPYPWHPYEHPWWCDPWRYDPFCDPYYHFGHPYWRPRGWRW